MFNIGARGCYLDGCYVTAMGAGASAVNYYVRAMYTGEILQLSDEKRETPERYRWPPPETALATCP